MEKRKLANYLLLGVTATLLATFIFKRKEKEPEYHPRDYSEIAAERTIRVTTEYNAISLHVEGDTLSGFHYDLIKAFARDHRLKADISPEMSMDKRMEGLETGKYDLVADGIPLNRVLKDSFLFTIPIILNKQVLVQRKPTSDHDSVFIKNQLALAGKTVHVVKNSPATLRIHNLGNEIGDTIYIEEIEKYGPEQLIALVAHGEIDYAVCDESIAQLAATRMPQIDVSTAISFTQFYSWGVNKQSPILLDSLNSWLTTFKKGKEYRKIYSKYYKD